MGFSDLRLAVHSSSLIDTRRILHDAHILHAEEKSHDGLARRPHPTRLLHAELYPSLLVVSSPRRILHAEEILHDADRHDATTPRRSIILRAEEVLHPAGS